MEATASRRPRRRSSVVARPLRQFVAIPVIMYLVWVCFYGDANLLAAAVPVPLPRRPRLVAAGSHAVGYRPIPAGGAGRGSSSSAGGARFGDDKRRIPSCPDALHNR
ncbi:unnamed protein product [Urochloa humidicola]